MCYTPCLTAGVGALVLFRGELSGYWANVPDGDRNRCRWRPGCSGGSLVDLRRRGKMPDAGPRAFHVELAGGSSARILVIPDGACGYAERPGCSAEAVEAWKGQRVRVGSTCFHTRSKPSRPMTRTSSARLTEATGVWIRRRDDRRCMADAYLGTEVERQLMASAGARWGDRRDFGRRGDHEPVDDRQRPDRGQAGRRGSTSSPASSSTSTSSSGTGWKRLLGVVRSHPDLIGLGIDESDRLGGRHPRQVGST